jgi:quinol-cytochrome oxidoreductase complex cytochrome b subunit
MALVLFGLLLFTGVLMMFAYEPSPDRAWQSVDSLQGDTLFGELIRGVHFWSANLLIPITVLHLLRVFLTGAYHGRRRANWYIGLGIIFFVLMSGFTGYLLPWDQTAYWAITICTEMLGQVPGIGPTLQGIVLGGAEIGPATMINFYALHIAVTPLAMIALLTWHFWKVREAGGVVLPAIRPNDTRDDLRALSGYQPESRQSAVVFPGPPGIVNPLRCFVCCGRYSIVHRRRSHRGGISAERRSAARGLVPDAEGPAHGADCGVDGARRSSRFRNCR